MTAIMEGSLSKIASGELTLDAFMDWQVHISPHNHQTKPTRYALKAL
jgi:hypothetical protein